MKQVHTGTRILLTILAVLVLISSSVFYRLHVRRTIEEDCLAVLERIEACHAEAVPYLLKQIESGSGETPPQDHLSVHAKLFPIGPYQGRMTVNPSTSNETPCVFVNYYTADWRDYLDVDRTRLRRPSLLSEDDFSLQRFRGGDFRDVVREFGPPDSIQSSQAGRYEFWYAVDQSNEVVMSLVGEIIVDTTIDIDISNENLPGADVPVARRGRRPRYSFNPFNSFNPRGNRGRGFRGPLRLASPPRHGGGDR